MDEPAEMDAGFPSGAWVGWYTYGSRPARHRMDLHLRFERATVRGDGIDDVGKFLIRGTYESDSRDCWWTKIYPGSHQVVYRGRQSGKVIAGRWEIPRIGSGGFRIWPKAAGELTEEYFVEEQAAPDAIDAIRRSMQSFRIPR